jgi:hypothetical protein
MSCQYRENSSKLRSAFLAKQSTSLIINHPDCMVESSETIAAGHPGEMINEVIFGGRRPHLGNVIA